MTTGQWWDSNGNLCTWGATFFKRRLQGPALSLAPRTKMRTPMIKPAHHLDSEPFAALIPESLARYRPIILAAIDFFINRLPSDRRALLDGRWAALSSTMPAEVRLLELLRICPTLHKLGQVLARERRLPIELRRQLQNLESMPPWTSPKAIRETLLSELGGNSLEDVRIAPQAVAEASVAVIVPFAWRPSRSEQEVEGVFKVLKPGVAKQIEEELTIWRELGAFLDEACERFDAPGLNYQDTFESVTELLRAEVRLDVEQAHLRAACKTYANSPDVCVPLLLPLCTSSVTAMTFLPGCKVTDVTNLDTPARSRLARAITDALIVAPMLSADRSAPFHADPHAGNLLATNDGRLGILDWSLVGHLKKSHREQMAQVFLGVVTRDAKRIARAIEALSLRPVGETSLRSIVDTALERLPWQQMPGLKWFLALLDAAVLRAQVRFDSDLILFRKTLLMLEGVLADVDPAFEVDNVIVSAVLRQLALEWPMRLLASPASRAFGTHLSNADLAAASASFPALALRAWSEVWWGSAAPS